MHITLAQDDHIPTLQQIYAHHVVHGTGSFELDPPDEAELASRLEKSVPPGCPGLWSSKTARFAVTVIWAFIVRARLIVLPWKIPFTSIRLFRERCG